MAFIQQWLRPIFPAETGLSLSTKITLLLLGLIGLTTGVWAQDVLLDDAVITFRVAENLAYGRGFVFNEGERIQVTTTPLYAIILAGGTWLFGSAMTAAHWLNLSLATLIPILAYGVGRRLYGHIAGLSGGLLLSLMPLLIIAFSMESYLYVALILASILAYTTPRLWLTGALVGLTCLVRGDGVLLGAVLLTFDYLTRLFGQLQESKLSGLITASRKPEGLDSKHTPKTLTEPQFRWRMVWSSLCWPLILPAIGIPLVWYIFATSYYGAPFPATLAAKTAQGEFNWLGVRFIDGLLAYWREWTVKEGHWLLYLWLPLWAIGLLSTLRYDLRWLILLGRDGLYIVGFTLLSVPAAEWYYAPLMPGIALLVGCGVERIATMSPATVWKIAITATLTTILAVSILPISQATIAQHPDWKAQVYPQVGRWLAENTNASANFATIDIGHIGYWSGRPIVDIVGLAQPDVAPQIAAGDFGYAIRHYQPDMVILGYSWLPEVQASVRFQADYIPRTYLRFEAIEEPMVVFSRRAGVKVQPRLPMALQSFLADFNGQIHLTGYALVEPLTHHVDVTLAWQAIQPIEVDYTVFIQLVTTDNQIIAQDDRQPQDGFYTTSHWQAGETVLDRHIFPIPAELPAGTYSLLIGLYDATTGVRLPHLDAAGNISGDYVRLSVR